jgi:hypothetical protein
MALNMTNSPGLVSESCHESTFKLIRHHKFYFQSGELGHSTNTIILKSNEHKSYDWVCSVICTFQSSQFFNRLSMHFGVVDHLRASALITADRLPPSWIRIAHSTHAPPVGNVGGWTPFTSVFWTTEPSRLLLTNRVTL